MMSTEFIGNEDKVDVNQRMQAGWAGSAFVDFSKGTWRISHLPG
jgi:hypothetical protein